jgi:Lrp/AsnC family transcriptional regulator, leucine-responsive regulatory protein
MRLDAKDRRILTILQEEGRVTNAELAERVNLSPSACLRRVQLLEEAGVIDRYVALLRASRVGRADTVFVEVSLDSQSDAALDTFEKAVGTCPEVMECCLMAGDTDYLLKLSVADGNDYERLHRQVLSRLPGVARIRSRFAIREVFRRTAYPVDLAEDTGD